MKRYMLITWYVHYNKHLLTYFAKNIENIGGDCNNPPPPPSEDVLQKMPQEDGG